MNLWHPGNITVPDNLVDIHVRRHDSVYRNRNPISLVVKGIWRLPPVFFLSRPKLILIILTTKSSWLSCGLELIEGVESSLG